MQAAPGILPKAEQTGQPREYQWVLLVTVAVLFYQLFLPPIVGVPDNGDYQTVTNRYHLFAADEQKPDRYFTYLVQNWRILKERPSPISMPLSSAHLVAGASVLASYVLSKDGVFDIRFIGFINSVIFLFALWLALPALAECPRHARKILYAIVILVFTDIMYISWFNSFLMDSATFLFLLLTAVFYLRFVKQVGHRTFNVFGFLICGLFLITSKAQHSILALPLSMLLFWQWNPLPSWSGRMQFWARGAAPALILAASLWVQLHVPRQYSSAAVYNIIFNFLLPNSKIPSATLAELNLDPGWAVHSGTDAYSPNTAYWNAEFFKTFSARASHARLLPYYLRHPDITWAMVRQGLLQGALQRPVGYGNLPKEPGRPPNLPASSFSLWSSLKVKVLETSFWFPLLYTLLPGALIVFGYFRKWVSVEMLAGALTLWMMTLMELLFGTLADIAETTRHLFIWNAMSDILLVSCAAMLLLEVSKRIRLARHAA